MKNSQVNNYQEIAKSKVLKFHKILLVFITIIVGISFGLVLSEVDDRDLFLLKAYQPSKPTILYDRYGKPFAELFIHKFELTPLERVPPTVLKTFLIVEDDQFYHHIGFDIPGIFRAFVKNVMAGRIVQGGSTLTQQVAKLLYLNYYKERKRTYTQKFKELILALKLEQNLSKDEILELYLNLVYFGHGCEGLSCASRIYFNKRVEDLTIGEAALLSRLPKSPIEFSPYKFPENAREQHQFVLNRLADEGMISEEIAQKIFHQFWDKYWGSFITNSPSTNVRADRLNLAPYFTNYVETILKNEPSIGYEKLYGGGLKVYTTLDLDLQLISQEEMLQTLKSADEVGRAHALADGKSGVDLELFDIYEILSNILPIGKPKISEPTNKQILESYIEENLLDSLEGLTLFLPLQNENSAFTEIRKRTLGFSHNLQVEGALISIDPSTGGIRAMIGGREFSPTNQFNRALFALRQPGSAFKIFVYGSAIENRMINSMSVLSDTPMQIIFDDGTVWTPTNYEGSYYGLVPATFAFAYSLNTCAVDLYNKTGPKPIIEFAQKLMKITNPYRLKAEPSLSLGASEITPKELAVATAIIANEGKDVIPYAIRYVVDENNQIIYSQEELVKQNIAQKVRTGEIQVISEGTAFIMRKMMEAAVQKGTLTSGIRGQNFKGDFAGKTGTTSSWSDAWVTAFNPEFVFTLWFGFDRSTITLGHGQAGGSVAAPTLGRIMRRYYEKTKKPLPEFSKEIPEEVETFECGYRLKPIIKDNLLVTAPNDYSCYMSGKIKDQREILMEELGITPEELGIGEKKKMRFND
ncbi:MAG: transglycosylase domain-containing protein [Leptospiraceae bacterium]|nr:transglycosylase domain-containing protein [Leptospiraceae bacterium]MDW7975227.1 transglycosylase domain-containing protein [Leptospiraceae bacterium]